MLDILAEVPDFRNKRGKRHPLPDILALAIIAMMCGCRSYTAIPQWGRTYHPNLAKALGFTHTKTPCASTLHYVFKAIDATALENALTHWAMAVLENLPTETQTHAIAIDGKTLRGSQKHGLPSHICYPSFLINSVSPSHSNPLRRKPMKSLLPERYFRHLTFQRRSSQPTHA
ncbi:MAG: transposase family protein [Candidatus Poribacteria bacterium]|nr:transposase family protein [Candidatus Poribacteria bacterium]